MRYLKAYLRAFWDIGRAASSLYFVVWLFGGANWAVGWYLGYLVVVASLGGPIKILLDK